MALSVVAFTFFFSHAHSQSERKQLTQVYTGIFSLFLSEDMDQGGGVLELHTQELKMPHTMIMQDFGRWSSRTM